MQGSESCRTSAGIGWRWVQSRRRDTGPHTSADTAEPWSSATCQPLKGVQKLVRKNMEEKSIAGLLKHNRYHFWLSL